MKKRVIGIFGGLIMMYILLPVQAAETNDLEVTGEPAIEVPARTLETETVTAWELKSVKTDKSSPQEKGASIEVSAEITGASDGLKYKFVWMKDNWKKWGVLQDFSSENSAEWVPEETGTYTLYADVKDAAGTVKTKSITYEIQKVNWQLNGINVSPEAPQKINQEIEIKADVSGNTTGLRYKYVWMKDNWKEWGVIQDFSTERQTTFRPETKGTYTIITNVKDLDGEVRTKSITYEVMTKVWKYEGIETSVASPQEKYCDPMTVCVKTTGETDGLKYKFVWSRDGWKEWGVLQDFSAKNSVKWTPGEAGEYQLIVNIKTIDGEVVTKSIPYTITKVQWSYDGIKAAPEGVQKKGEVVEIEAKASGNTEGLQYKYVWMKDNWKKWGVIQSFSGKNTAEWKTPKESGTYQIIVDVKDRDGNVITKQISYDLVTQFWSHEGIDINGGVQEQIYTKIPVTAKVSGETENLQYKFVWTKNNWEKWGVIREFSGESTAQWYPKEPGTYTIYCNIKDPDGRVQTRTEEYTVLDAPWQLDEIAFSGSGSYYVGDTMTVSAVTSGENEGLQYKFVCRRGENWGDWEVVQEFSPNNTVTIPVEKAVNYHIYVDIKDARGVIFDAVEATGKGYTYSSLQVSSGTTAKGNPVDITPQLTGPSGAKAEYKYVWMKDNWSQWGVIKDFSDASKISWTPTEIGTYTILVDVKINGIVKTKTATVNVTKSYAEKLEEIKQYTYVKYKYGGTTLEGWDCSGFTQWAMRYCGIEIARTAAQQSLQGVAVDVTDMTKWQAGDLIFFTKEGRVNHAALYLGDGMMMHALNTRYNTYITSVAEYTKMDPNNKLAKVRRFF